ncbi:MAG: hypothetical protein IH987_05940 [Planctomycetes bacterium]|nr:hypothetical protein [Planctomycetota bacterium]
MITDGQHVLVENFRECVRVYQRYTMLAIGAAFCLLLFSLRLKREASQNEEMRVEVLYGDVPTITAWFIALGFYFVLGIFAYYAVHRAKQIVQRLADNAEIIEALSMYPSLATEPNPLFRIGSVIISPCLVVASMLIELTRSYESKVWTDYPWGGFLIVAVIVLAPCISILIELKAPVGTVSNAPDDGSGE